ncbi:single stranded DNA-binding domain-containing protein [Filimonas lacunae]|nr:hypothetical protein [Filimonas lacunae]BAV09561.1 hypothetical protein FLA_5612 [Filimonas lacunae]
MITITARSQVKIKATEAMQYIGKQVTVCDSVYGIKFLDKAKAQPTFLNIGAAYPKSPFTIVIFGSSRPNFSVTPEKLYTGKKICVTGTLQEYNGKAEVVVTKPEEIVIQ